MVTAHLGRVGGAALPKGIGLGESEHEQTTPLGCQAPARIGVLSEARLRFDGSLGTQVRP